MKFHWIWILCLFLLFVSACGSGIATPNRPGGYGEEIQGQPKFPDLVDYWVIDNGCNFSEETKRHAYDVFEALNKDHIAQVAVVCQTGVTGDWSTADTWISEWLNHEGLGSMEDKRALAILIRPDVQPEDFRIILNPNDDLYWFTSLVDAYPIKQEAADYANYNDFDGCLDSLARNIDAFLRDKWKVYGPTPTTAQ